MRNLLLGHVKSAVAIVLVLILMLSQGCGGINSTILIVIIDLTGSVPADAQADAFRLLQTGIRQMKRGDVLIVIPLTGDATTELPGRILRFEVSRTRKAYDEDLKQFATEAAQKLEALQRLAAQNPAQVTDLFGAFLIATDEVKQRKRIAESARSETRIRLLVLSDFLQDDKQANFKRDPRLANETSAKQLAAERANAMPLGFNKTEVYLGLVRSDDLKKIDQARRDAIKAFWIEYCRAGQPSSVQFALDGPGQAEIFLRD